MSTPHLLSFLHSLNSSPTYTKRYEPLSPVSKVPNEKSEFGFFYLQEKPYYQEKQTTTFEIYDQYVGVTYEMQFNSSRAMVLLSFNEVPVFVSETEYIADVVDTNALLNNMTEHFITIPVYKANDRGIWFMLVANLDTEYPLEYTVNMTMFCPNNCQGHGSCRKYIKECACDDNYVGIDCSVYSEEIVPFSNRSYIETNPLTLYFNFLTVSYESDSTTGFRSSYTRVVETAIEAKQLELRIKSTKGGINAYMVADNSYTSYLPNPYFNNGKLSLNSGEEGIMDLDNIDFRYGSLTRVIIAVYRLDEESRFEIELQTNSNIGLIPSLDSKMTNQSCFCCFLLVFFGVCERMKETEKIAFKIFIYILIGTFVLLCCCLICNFFLIKKCMTRKMAKDEGNMIVMDQENSEINDSREKHDPDQRNLGRAEEEREQRNNENFREAVHAGYANEALNPLGDPILDPEGLKESNDSGAYSHDIFKKRLGISERENNPEWITDKPEWITEKPPQVIKEKEEEDSFENEKKPGEFRGFPSIHKESGSHKQIIKDGSSPGKKKQATSLQQKPSSLKQGGSWFDSEPQKEEEKDPMDAFQNQKHEESMPRIYEEAKESDSFVESEKKKDFSEIEDSSERPKEPSVVQENHINGHGRWVNQERSGFSDSESRKSKRSDSSDKNQRRNQEGREFSGNVSKRSDSSDKNNWGNQEGRDFSDSESKKSSSSSENHWDNQEGRDFSGGLSKMSDSSEENHWGNPRNKKDKGFNEPEKQEPEIWRNPQSNERESLKDWADNEKVDPKEPNGKFKPGGWVNFEEGDNVANNQLDKYEESVSDFEEL